MKRQAVQHTYGEEYGDHEEEDPGFVSAARKAIGGQEGRSWELKLWSVGGPASVAPDSISVHSTHSACPLNKRTKT